MKKTQTREIYEKKCEREGVMIKTLRVFIAYQRLVSVIYKYFKIPTIKAVDYMNGVINVVVDRFTDGLFCRNVDSVEQCGTSVMLQVTIAVGNFSRSVFPPKGASYRWLWPSVKKFFFFKTFLPTPKPLVKPNNTDGQRR